MRALTLNERIQLYQYEIHRYEKEKKQKPEIYAQRHYDRLIGINQKLLQRLK